MESVKEKIRAKIKSRNKGEIILPSDYELEFSMENTKKALLRLNNEGFIERLTRGVYLYPEKNDVLGVLYPGIETITQEIAKRDNARIIPTGMQVCNL
ncbi:DUF6088 family protein [Flavivirga jejuensis]|uniref:DUF6088 family protein n=1 Tax=Flavivirga jejuensis TaxID=870487 RepID=A0ABT8WV63_9FLAO|nr:DUF6088 family protein [Flavivirga jejuensis]MDO5977075.1 DUF6088 family protein [Flavivirga jejuensis]